MNEKEFLESLLALADQCDVALSEEQGRMCYEHIELMLEWNRSINLTRITDMTQILVKHLLDSLVPSRWLPPEGSAVDIGSGAGFPGVPLRILLPNLEMHLVDSHGKKVSFLKVLTAKLGIGRLSVSQGRWQDLISGDDSSVGKQFDVITMRALRIEEDHLSSLASRALKNGGILAWWAGPEGLKNRSLGSAIRSGVMGFGGAYPYTLPGTRGPRYLCVWKKTAS